MAHQDMTSTPKELNATKQRPSSSKFQTSLSQPAPSTEQKPPSRRHLTLQEPLNKNYPQSPAELYILSRTQMFAAVTDQQDISPTSPSTPSSIGGTNISTSTIVAPMGHSDRMSLWHKQEADKINKKQKHRYVYGPPARKGGFPFSSPTTFTQSNLLLSSQRKN